MLYTKPIGDITFQDVVDFCAQRTRENINLDYKEDINASLAKTVAAMANTWGGLIIIGVADDDSLPRLPVEGITFREGLTEQINNIILGNITPPVFPEVQVCTSDDGTHVFVVVRVPQSNSTPHAIQGSTTVYLRTNTSNEPEELATVDRVQWLVERRKKSEELKNRFYERAEQRLSSLPKPNTRGADLSIGISPLYPFETLVNYRELNEGFLNSIAESGYGGNYAPASLRLSTLKPTQDGAYAFRSDQIGYLYEEINQYGFFFRKQSIGDDQRGEGNAVVCMTSCTLLLMDIDLFLGSMAKFYARIGYWGFIEVQISIKQHAGIEFLDLEPLPGTHRFRHTNTPIDRAMHFTKQFSAKELFEERSRIIAELMSEIIWAIGFSHSTTEDVLAYLREARRV